MPLATLVRRSLIAIAVALGMALATAAPAAAHTGDEARLGGWADGLLHPVLGLDHLAAMVAVGVLAAIGLGRLPLWALPSSFLGGMLVGGALGLRGWEMGMVEALIALSVLALGVLIAVGTHLPRWVWLLPAVGVAGFAHGNAHGLEAPGAAAPTAYIAGFLLATAALHALGAMGGVALGRAEVGRVLGGAAIALFGTILLVG